MAAYCILDEFEVHRNEAFLEQAEKLKPELYINHVKAERIIEIEQNEMQETIVKKEEPVAILLEKKLKKAESLILDFGNHYVGYLTLDLESWGSHPDAPAYIYFRFAERLDELAENPEEYNGWIGKGWIQEEYVHVEQLPYRLSLPRRYAFRYLEIKVIDVSPKYSLIVKEAYIKEVASAKWEKVPKAVFTDGLLKKIDEVSIRTLHNCMHTVFEDGPKRDKRMWLGDLRLQALTNYETFQNTDLVKRCLYLFGGLTFNEGKVAACLFIEPEAEPDDTYLFDYALLFGSVLSDYFEQTGDIRTLEALYPVAIRQIEIGLNYLNAEGIIPDHSGQFWCFIDWGEGLNTQAASMAVLIYAMRYGLRLAGYKKDEKCIQWLKEWIQKLQDKVITHFWDEQQAFFVSGTERQVSWATQVWMILAEIFSKEENRKLLRHTIIENPDIHMVSPYMYHYFIEALIECDEKEYALEEIKRYWGGMIREGADTFWEIYNPDNKYESPYGSVAVNSFCHAWSCTPTYFLRKYYSLGRENDNCIYIR